MADLLPVSTLGRRAADEIAAVLAGVSETQIAAFRAAVLGSRQALTHGVGREGLVMQSFAMRLMHLGFPVSVVGDMTAGPTGPETLFVCSAGPGAFTTIGALMDIALNTGASVALFTAHPEEHLAQKAHYVIEVPAQTMTGSQKGAASEQIMGSVYEQALWVLLDCVVWQLAKESGCTQEQMAARHTNME
jgi:6-phospho-3-hexuloisomerase